MLNSYQKSEFAVYTHKRCKENKLIISIRHFDNIKSHIDIGVGRGGARGAGPPNNLRGGGGNIPFGPPNNPPTFSFNFYVKQGKNHKCTKLKRKIIINVTLI